MALTELARETTTGGASRAASRAACEVLGVLIHGETERVERGEGVDDATDSAETEGGGGVRDGRGGDVRGGDVREG